MECVSECVLHAMWFLIETLIVVYYLPHTVCIDGVVCRGEWAIIILLSSPIGTEDVARDKLIYINIYDGVNTNYDHLMDNTPNDF